MNRRGFLKLLGGAVAGIALDQAIPGNRVWFFPKNIVLADPLCDPARFYGLQSVALQLENVQALIPTIYKNDYVSMDLFGEPGRASVVSPRGVLRGIVNISHIDRETNTLTIDA